MKQLVPLIAAVSLGVFLTACQDTVNTIENREKQATVNVVKDSRFVTDSFLKRRLVLQAVKESVNASGFKTVEVRALNNRTGFFPELWTHFTGENPYPIEYKFEWQDQNGMTVSSPMTGIWKRITIRPGETVCFQSTAPTANCKDFVLSVKEKR